MGAEPQPTERTAEHLTDEVGRTVAKVFAQPADSHHQLARQNETQRAPTREEGTCGR